MNEPPNAFLLSFLSDEGLQHKNLLSNNIPHCKSNKFISQDKKVSASRTFAHYHISSTAEVPLPLCPRTVLGLSYQLLTATSNKE
jgi:hypothetical protein